MRCPICEYEYIYFEEERTVEAGCCCKIDPNDYDIVFKDTKTVEFLSNPIDWSDPNFPQVIQVDTAGNETVR